MKMTDVKKNIKNKCFEKFKHLGFNKYQYGIDKKTINYGFYIGFGIVNSDISFPTTFHYGISSKYLNNILKQIFPDKEFKLNAYATVYGTKQTRLFDNKEYPVLEYDIYTENDIDVLVNDLYNFYTKNALPFLEELMDIQRLSSFINSDKVLNESMQLPTTLKNGLIMAKLANDPNYDNLKLKYSGLINNLAEWEKKDIEKVVVFLDSHSLEEIKKIAEGK